MFKKGSKSVSKFKGDFDGQHEDEEVLMMFRKHPLVMRKGLIGVLVCLLIGMIPSLIWPTHLEYLWFVLVGLIIGLVFMFWSWIGWNFTYIIMTDQRLISITQQGLWNKTVVDVGLDKIQNINYQISGFQETVLGYGTILVQTFVGDLVIDFVHHPDRMQEKLVKTLKKLDVGNFAEQALKMDKTGK